MQISRRNNLKFVIELLLLFALAILLNANFAFAVGKGAGKKGFVGSAKCGECHEDAYNLWKITPHANMLVDAKKNPDRIIANYFPEDLPFTKDNIYYTLGSHWLQKYLTILEDGHIYQLPNIWNISEGDWEPYSIFDWKDKPYVIFCDGCHTVGFDKETSTFFEEGIGCEACHGPGEKHAKSEDAKDIVNPDKLSKERRDMICEQCHTDGNATLAPELPFPIGFMPGDDISDYYSDFFMPKPKSKDWYWGTADYKERHRMFMFWRSKFYSTSRACDVCGFERGPEKKKGMERGHGSDYMTRNQYCGTCHRSILENYTKHSRHSENITKCVDCHLPKLAPSKDRYSIHDHKFDFSRPKPTCAECHYSINDDAASRDSDPLFIHFQKKYEKSATFKCNQCHYNKLDAHAIEHNGKGKECTKCHFTKDESAEQVSYKHNSKKVAVKAESAQEDICKICHETTPSYKHKYHEDDDLKVKLEGSAQESCKRCHEPFVERW